LAIQIVSVSVYAQWQPFVDGAYTCSGGRSAVGFDSTVVRLETDAGIVGWGEMAPLGSFYDPAFAAGAREGLRLLAPLVLDLDPRQHGVLTTTVDRHLAGHPYAKSALDMAAWDVAGIATDLPLAELLGGRHGETVELYRSVAQGSPQEMADQAAHYVDAGYRRIQVKVGLDPADDIERMEAVVEKLPSGTIVYADANAAWTPAAARRFLRATRHLDYVLEQPCADHDANVTVRAACDRPFVLDESIDSLASLLRAHRAGLIDGVTLKVARLGGVSRTRLVRDVAVELGQQVTVEDTGGAQVATAAIAHLSLSTPTPARAHTVDFHHWVSVANGTGDLECHGGTMTAPTGPGLGIEVDVDALGAPLFTVRR
jgi:L-alanine-DL-glutamate epimerase-like enolase superfamily enzyme